ncbi:MAG TPA: deoxyribonuclease V [Gammaproteobacteria bacterium]
MPARYPYYITPAEARAEQEHLRHRLIRRGNPKRVRYVAGVDCAFPQEGLVTRGAVAVLAWPTLEYVEHAVVERPTDFPYVPGLLSFREVPTLLAALAKLKTSPDLLLCDGQGYAHPRRLGFASHLGLASGIPSIGVAKSRLIGTHRQPGRKAGAHAPLMDGAEVIGAVLRTREGVAPLFISSGHKVGLDAAVQWVLGCCRGYRLPETTRWADGLAGDPDFRVKARGAG